MKKLVGNLSLISSQMKKISIYSKDDLVCIDLEIELMYKKGKNQILLRFTGVVEYSFYYLSGNIFYNVERCKFFKSEDLFYISFDPVDETELIAGEDQDYIKAGSVEAYFL